MQIIEGYSEILADFVYAKMLLFLMLEISEDCSEVFPHCRQYLTFLCVSSIVHKLVIPMLRKSLVTSKC